MPVAYRVKLARASFLPLMKVLLTFQTRMQNLNAPRHSRFLRDAKNMLMELQESPSMTDITLLNSRTTPLIPQTSFQMIKVTLYTLTALADADHLMGAAMQTNQANFQRFAFTTGFTTCITDGA
jgi:hypothetical protein